VNLDDSVVAVTDWERSNVARAHRLAPAEVLDDELLVDRPSGSVSSHGATRARSSAASAASGRTVLESRRRRTGGPAHAWALEFEFDAFEP
jgi:hypothetical protein